jgi:hypothetical protein
MSRVRLSRRAPSGALLKMRISLYGIKKDLMVLLKMRTNLHGIKNDLMLRSRAKLGVSKHA